MKSIRFEAGADEFHCRTDERLSETLLVDYLKLAMACKGQGLCATCHVVVIEGGDTGLTPMTEKESRALERLSQRSPGSRLACQARIIGDIKVRVPKGIYIESTAQLESMLGKRATTNMLDPATGSILVAEGQIISRFVLKKLENVNLKPWELGRKIKG